MNDSDDIAELLATLTNSLEDGKGRVELLQFDTYAESSLGSSRSLADLVRQGSVRGSKDSMANGGVNMSRQGSLTDVADVEDVADVADVPLQRGGSGGASYDPY